MNNWNLSHIVISNYDHKLKEILESEITKNNQNSVKIIWFNFESILVENVREIFEKTSFLDSKKRFFIIQSLKFPVVSQNALLKLLEEPPENSFFILVVPSKAILLPTIRSRLPLRFIKNEIKISPEIVNLSYDLRNKNLNILKDFISKIEKLKQEDAKIVLEKLLKENINRVEFSPENYKMFEEAMQLIPLNAKISSLFLNILLAFYLKI
jgi:DNA polymerase-3 subunit delta'